MTQPDDLNPVLGDRPFALELEKLNTRLAALVDGFVGTELPTVTQPNMRAVATNPTGNQPGEYRRNSADTAWIFQRPLDAPSSSGTVKWIDGDLDTTAGVYQIPPNGPTIFLVDVGSADVTMELPDTDLTYGARYTIIRADSALFDQLYITPYSGQTIRGFSASGADQDILRITSVDGVVELLNTDNAEASGNEWRVLHGADPGWYTLTADATMKNQNYHYLLDGTSASVELTLLHPAAANMDHSQDVVVKAINITNACTVAPSTGGEIDDEGTDTAVSFSGANEVMRFRPDPVSGKWYKTF